MRICGWPTFVGTRESECGRWPTYPIQVGNYTLHYCSEHRGQHVQMIETATKPSLGR